MNIESIKKWFKPSMQFMKILPTVFATIFLVILLKNIFMYYNLIDKLSSLNSFVSVPIFTIIGSIFSGNAVNSYIIGGYMNEHNINLIAITSFMVAWVSVGFMQSFVEVKFFPKKFVIYRNLLAFIFSMLVGVTVYLLVRFL